MPQLFQQRQESLEQRVQRLGLPKPTTALGAAGLGATAKQQDMAGTRAAIRSTIRERMAEPDTLQQRERQTGTRQVRTASEAQKGQQVEEFQKFGSLDERVQNLVEKRIQAATPEMAAPAIHTTGLSTALEIDDLSLASSEQKELYELAKGLLLEFAKSPDENQRELTLIKLQNLGISADEANNLIDTSASAIGATFAEAVQDEITAADIDWTAMGFDNISAAAELLGVDQELFGKMGIDDIQQAVTDLQQAEFTRIQGLRAQLMSTPVGSAQRDILLRELRDLGSVGMTGIEAQAVTVPEDIDLAGQVKIGDEIWDVDELFKDEGLSGLIQDWVAADPIYRDSIIPEDEYPELTAWIKTNSPALNKLSETLGETVEAFTGAQQDYSTLLEASSLPSDVLAKFVPGYDPEKIVTSKEAAEAINTFNATGLGQLLINEPKVGAIIAEEIAGLTGLDDIHYEQLASFPPAHLKNQIDTMNDYNSSIFIQSFMPDMTAKDFLLGIKGPKKVREYLAVFDKFEKINRTDIFSLPGEAGSIIKGLTVEELSDLADAPHNINKLTDFIKATNEIANVSTVDDAASYLFGTPLSYEAEVLPAIAKLRSYAALGDVNAKRQLEELGDISPDSLISQVQGAQEGMDVKDTLSGVAYERPSLSKELLSFTPSSVFLNIPEEMRTQLEQGGALTTDSISSMIESNIRSGDTDKIKQVLELIENLPTTGGMRTKSQTAFRRAKRKLVDDQFNKIISPYLLDDKLSSVSGVELDITLNDLINLEFGNITNSETKEANITLLTSVRDRLLADSVNAYQDVGSRLRDKVRAIDNAINEYKNWGGDLTEVQEGYGPADSDLLGTLGGTPGVQESPVSDEDLLGIKGFRG